MTCGNDVPEGRQGLSPICEDDPMMKRNDKGSNSSWGNSVPMLNEISKKKSMTYGDSFAKLRK